MNDFTGDAHNVVQARDIHGGVHFHAPSPTTPGQVVVGPVPRQPRHFQDRAQVARLSETTGVAVLCAVTGQRGVGKTQVAGAYARQRIADGWSVAWIPAETPDSATAGLLDLADALRLRDETNDPNTLARLRSHLQTRTDPALLVFDNVVDPEVVRPHLLAAGPVQIVLTSAFRAVERIGEPVPVDLFTTETAVRFLTETTGLDDEPGARALAAELGRLPLALTQAAARITAIERDYATYLDRLNELPVERYLRARPGDPYPRGVAEAVLLAVERFDRPEGATERGLLDLLAVLSPDGVPRYLLATSRDPTEVDDALEQLLDASLIEFVGGATVTMHRLTQRVLRDRAENLPALATEAVRLLDGAVFPRERAWELRERGNDLVRQVEALSAHVPACVTFLALRAWGVRQLIDSASASRAVPVARSVLADSQEFLGPEHKVTQYSAVNLAEACRDAGLLGEAVTRYEQIFTDARQRLGDPHEHTLTTANNLASAYEVVGRFGDAIRLFERTLATSRWRLGDDHERALSVANNLAIAYENTGRLRQAIPLYEETLAVRLRVLGPDHPRSLDSANNLAHAYRTAGRLDDAIPLYERTVGHCRRVLGDDHLDTIGTRDNLAIAYEAAGRVEEALATFERNLADLTRLLGPDHPRNVVTMGNLANAYNSAGRLAESISLYERILAVHRTGTDPHVDTIRAASNLAYAYRAAGRLAECLEMFEDTLATASRAFGDAHPDVLLIGNNLANAYEAAGRLADAIALYERTLATARQALDDDHPLRLGIARNLAYAYHVAGRVNEARALIAEFPLDEGASP